MESSNESAASFRWLASKLGLGREQPSPTREVWQRVRDQMRALDQTIMSSQDWISDFWLCKSSRVNYMGLVPEWDPPDELDEWNGIALDLSAVGVAGSGRPTNHAAFTHLLANATGVAERDSDNAVLEFTTLDGSTRSRGDLFMVQAQHVRAWLATALGNLLMSIALSPQSYREQLVSEAQRRLLIPRQLGIAPKWGLPFVEGELGLLYNCRQSPQGNLHCSAIRIGQGDEWMRHWQWLSRPLEAEHVLPAVQLAARLMRCAPLVEALFSALDADDTEHNELALAVLRRWLLSLKVMVWLEDALHQHWRTVRPRDLSCFAFNALKPEWPRRLVALSHRSADAKPALFATKAWDSSLFAIDANYVPSWETNTGMIWGLFAATPALVRIESPRYRESEWCQREAELIEHLEERCDFLTSRHVHAVDLEHLPDLDRIVDASQTDEVPLLLSEFPPPSMVYVPSAAHEWELRMLRAAGALRVLRAVYGSTYGANWLCAKLLSSDEPVPVPPPTNNPEGWGAYRKVFRDLQSECGSASAVIALQFPPEYADPDPEAANRFADSIPDLSGGYPTIEDVLVALEWQATLLPLAEENNIGDMILIDLRGLTRSAWETSPHLSMLRGIAALRSSTRPIWFIQLPDQRVETWGLSDDRPIFTQYLERQFRWMWEGYFPSEWPAAYAERCELTMCEELRERCGSTRSGQS